MESHILKFRLCPALALWDAGQVVEVKLSMLFPSVLVVLLGKWDSTAQLPGPCLHPSFRKSSGGEVGRASPFPGSPLGRVWAVRPSRLWSRGGSALRVKSASPSPAGSPRSPVLSFAEVVSRRKDKPLPLQPSDLSGTTFDSFSLKRIGKQKQKQKRRREALNEQSGLVPLPSAAFPAGTRPIRGLRDA